MVVFFIESSLNIRGPNPGRSSEVKWEGDRYFPKGFLELVSVVGVGRSFPLIHSSFVEFGKLLHEVPEFEQLPQPLDDLLLRKSLALVVNRPFCVWVPCEIRFDGGIDAGEGKVGRMERGCVEHDARHTIFGEGSV